MGSNGRKLRGGGGGGGGGCVQRLGVWLGTPISGAF